MVLWPVAHPMPFVFASCLLQDLLDGSTCVSVPHFQYAHAQTWRYGIRIQSDQRVTKL